MCFEYLSFRKSLFQLVFLIVISGCANIVTPTGGEKDIIPPLTVQELPPNKSTNFNTGEISITFNEYIVLKDPLRQIIISPPIEPAPEYQIKKRTLIIKLPDNLRPKTTYTINFGNAIVDNTEGNILTSYQYVFSTGDLIDSLFVAGNVINAFTRDRLSGVTVMLYQQMDDSLPYKSRPAYFAISNESGFYRIANIGEGDYKLFAIKDENSNYIFDQPSELIGFKKNPVNPLDTSTQNIAMFLNAPEKQKLINVFNDSPGKLVMVFNVPVDTVRYLPVKGDDLPAFQYQEYNLTRDTLVIWASDTTLDSLNFIVISDDTPLDTVLVPMKRKHKTLSDFPVSLNIGRNNSLPPGDSLVITSSSPLVTLNKSFITLLKDSVTPQEIIINSFAEGKRSITIKFNSAENSTYYLIISPGAFTDLYGRRNDSIIQKINIKPIRDFGSLSLTINKKDTANLLLQILDFKNNLVRETEVTDSSMLFDFLDPGEYRLKIIVDENNNGQWDTGNYLKNIHPERVLYFEEAITIRANWFVDQTWNLPSLNNN